MGPAFGPSNGQIRAKRCSECSITYPPHVMTCRVKECAKPTWAIYKDDPDEDWETKVAYLNGQTVDAPVVSPYQHPPYAVVPVGLNHGRLWLKHDDLLRVGYLYLEAGSIVFVNERFFELEGFQSESKVKQTEAQWWVTEIVTEGAADSLEPSHFEKAPDG